MTIEAMVWALHLPIKGSGEKGVLVGLCNHVDDAGRCWPSLTKLALYSGCDERTVRRHLRSLEELGVLRTQQREGRASVYIVDLTWTPDKMTGVGPRTECPDTPDKMTPESLREPLKEESPPMRAPAREGGEVRTHPRTGRKLAPMPHGLPEGWQPQAATLEGLKLRWHLTDQELSDELTDFTDYYRNEHPDEQRLDWNATFRGWVRKSCGEFRKRRGAADIADAAGAKDRAAQRRSARRAFSPAELAEHNRQALDDALGRLHAKPVLHGDFEVVDPGAAGRKNGAG